MAFRAPRLTLSNVFRIGTVLAVGLAFVACTVSESPVNKRKKAPVDPGDEYFGDEVPFTEQPIEPSFVNEDSGAFGASERPKAKDDAGAIEDADAGIRPKLFCEGPLKAGDLAIVELMVTSRAGSNDDGEWVEVRNMRDCWLDVNGVSVESPRGAAKDVATITSPMELGPGEAFVAVDTLDPLKNHGIVGRVAAFNAADVLKNDGDTVVVKKGAVVVDTVTYPKFSNLTAGRALSFPDDCKPTDRTSWPRWSLTFEEFAPGFKGTPTTPNDDVTCF